MTLDSLSGTQKTSFRRKNRTKDDVSNVSLIEAWKIWFSGDLPADTILWGISILWWERIGKLMQVLGATTIIADIVGPEKIRQFGTSLQSTITSTTLIQFLKQCFDWYAVIFSQTILKEFANESPKARPERKFSQLDLLNYVICFFLTAWVTVSAQLYSFQWISLIEFIIIYVCLLISIAPILTVLSVVGLTLLGLVINTVIIKPIATILEHPSLDRSTKIVSLLLLLVGFHFEMLAS